MRTVIYLDVLLLVNFVVGAAFLLAAGLLCGACCSPLRLVGGAGAAAVSSLALQHPEIGEAFRAYLKEFCKTL